MSKPTQKEGPDKTAFEIMSRLVKQPPKTHDEMTRKAPSKPAAIRKAVSKGKGKRA